MTKDKAYREYKKTLAKIEKECIEAQDKAGEAFEKAIDEVIRVRQEKIDEADRTYEELTKKGE